MFAEREGGTFAEEMQFIHEKVDTLGYESDMSFPIQFGIEYNTQTTYCVVKRQKRIPDANGEGGQGGKAVNIEGRAKDNGFSFGYIEAKIVADGPVMNAVGSGR